MRYRQMGHCHRYEVMVDEFVVGHVDTPVYAAGSDTPTSVAIDIGDRQGLLPATLVESVDPARRRLRITPAGYVLLRARRS